VAAIFWCSLRGTGCHRQIPSADAADCCHAAVSRREDQGRFRSLRLASEGTVRSCHVSTSNLGTSLSTPVPGGFRNHLESLSPSEPALQESPPRGLLRLASPKKRVWHGGGKPSLNRSCFHAKPMRLRERATDHKQAPWHPCALLPDNSNPPNIVLSENSDQPLS
jgi:hypothetical protein